MLRIPQEEPCPIPECLLGDLYRASPAGLHALVATIPAHTRAMLAVYCSRRSHLTTLGLAIASTCERNDLIAAGGQFGLAIFTQSREAPAVIRETRRKVTLSTNSYKPLFVAQDLI